MKTFAPSYGPNVKARWSWLTGDMSWDDYGGSWYRKDASGAYWVLRFENCEEWGDGASGYYCDVKRLVLLDLPEVEIDSALISCGYALESDGTLYLGQGDEQTDPAIVELMIVEACISYGLGAPMGSEQGKRAIQVRGMARKLAEALMRDEEARERALDRPVNAIGTSARNYGVGQLGLVFRKV